MQGALACCLHQNADGTDVHCDRGVERSARTGLACGTRREWPTAIRERPRCDRDQFDLLAPPSTQDLRAVARQRPGVISIRSKTAPLDHPRKRRTSIGPHTTTNGSLVSPSSSPANLRMRSFGACSTTRRRAQRWATLGASAECCRRSLAATPRTPRQWQISPQRHNRLERQRSAPKTPAAVTDGGYSFFRHSCTAVTPTIKSGVAKVRPMGPSSALNSACDARVEAGGNRTAVRASRGVRM